jgi:transcriptional regulator GlxA family with amidase domain
VRDVADCLGVSRRALERRFGAVLGRTVLEELTRCRFNRAERLLRETDLPVKTVVYMAGFGRAENMRQAFTKQFQLSPRAYRAQVRMDRSSARHLSQRLPVEPEAQGRDWPKRSVGASNRPL